MQNKSKILQKKSGQVKKRLVIVGGGFGGITLAKEILSNAKEDFSVTLIDKNDYQLFHPVLFKAVSTFAEPSAIFSVATVKFEDIFKDQEITILKKEVKDLLFDKNQVALKAPGNRLSVLTYDYLVLAAGSEPDFINVELVKSRALTFKSFEDTLKIKAEVEYVLKNKAKREDINVVVIGGGVTGCALISELYNYVHKLASLLGHPHQTINFKLIAGKEILPVLSPWTRGEARKSMEKMGIEVLTGLYVGSLGADGCILSDGTFINADVLVWTGGVKPNSLVENFPEKSKSFKNKRFYLKSTQYLKAQGHKNVFVVGDIVYSGRGSDMGPATAQLAIHQAKYVARSLTRTIKGKKIRRYCPIKSIYVVELGENFAFADIGPLKLTNWSARYVHRQGYLRYLKSIMPIHKALVWLEKYKSL